MSEEVAATHTCAHSISNAGWDQEGVAAQLTLLNHPHMAASTLTLPVTYMRPSELPALRKKNVVPPLVLLLTCWSVVIAASETGVFTKTGIRDGSVVGK